MFKSVPVLCRFDFWSLISEGLLILHESTTREITGIMQEACTDSPLHPGLRDFQYHQATELHLVFCTFHPMILVFTSACWYYPWIQK